MIPTIIKIDSTDDTMMSSISEAFWISTEGSFDSSIYLLWFMFTVYSISDYWQQYAYASSCLISFCASAGFAFPCDFFITWPTKKPIALSCPA